MQTALIVESGEIREVMHAALLLGYGASALCPYLTYAILDDLVKRGKIQENYETAEEHRQLNGVEALVADVAKYVELGVGKYWMWQTNHLAVGFVRIQNS